MRLVNTKAHALFDYGLALVLLFSPWLFDFPSGGVAAWTAMLLGIVIASLALLTRFEFSVIKLIDLKWHLRTDFVLGLLLAASPWLFEFKEEVFKPHLVFGLALMVIAMITDRVLYRTFRQTIERTDEPPVQKSEERTKNKRRLL